MGEYVPAITAMCSAATTLGLAFITYLTMKLRAGQERHDVQAALNSTKVATAANEAKDIAASATIKLDEIHNATNGNMIELRKRLNASQAQVANLREIIGNVKAHVPEGTLKNLIEQVHAAIPEAKI